MCAHRVHSFVGTGEAGCMKSVAELVVQMGKDRLDRWSVFVERWRKWSWLQVPVEGQTEAVPVEKWPFISIPMLLDSAIRKSTYRTLKLCPLSSITLEDVVKADVGTGELLDFGFARAGHRTSFAITAGVALQGITVELVELPLEAVFATYQA